MDLYIYTPNFHLVLWLKNLMLTCRVGSWVSKLLCLGWGLSHFGFKLVTCRLKAAKAPTYSWQPLRSSRLSYSLLNGWWHPFNVRTWSFERQWELQSALLFILLQSRCAIRTSCAANATKTPFLSLQCPVKALQLRALESGWVGCFMWR